MAEAVVKYVLEKIGETAYREALVIYGAGGKVDWARRELEWVSAFLRDADAKAQQNLDNRVKQWVKNVEEVAYMIEDTLDKFLVEVGGGPEKLGVLKKIRSMPKILVARHRVSKEIDDIKERVREIRETAVRYGIEKLSDNSSASGNGIAIKPQRLPTLPDNDKTEVLGFESDKNQIVQQLTEESNLTRSVISIVGTGGLGKTTLAKLVYKSAAVKNHFDYCMWITISNKYDLIDILRKMLKQICGDQLDMQRLDTEDLVREIHKFLLQKRYLVVLDDVWSTALWTELKKVLPEVENGSRALITTRSKDVAQDANCSSKPHELQVLNEEKSLELMLNMAFPNQYANECTDDLLDLANQFAKRCGGLPLALIVMGRILSKKQPDFNTWSGLLGKIKWHTDGKECMEIVSTSYEQLPLHLKLCFMYFAIYPEDWEIKASYLLRMWVAEGFIPQDEIMEDTAESYLEELAQRCMVQITKRSCRGSIKYCRVHDILHDLATRKAREGNFVMVQSSSNNNSSSGSSARRLALHIGDTTPVQPIGPNLLSLTSFGNYVPNSNEHRMARVINIDYTNYGTEIDYDLKSMKHLNTLRYFRIRSGGHAKVDTKILSHLAPWKFLQTVDTCDSIPKRMDRRNIQNSCYAKIPYCLHSRKNDRVQELHHSFWNNRMLRHVIWSTNGGCRIMGPPSSAQLENLLTLKGVHARDEWTVKLPHFPRLRKLKVDIHSDFDWVAMANLMSKLEHLGSLSLMDSPAEPMKDPCITPAFRHFGHMYVLCLRCTWPVDTVFDSSICPPHLVKLYLAWSRFRQDPMSELGKLPCLRKLYLGLNAYMGEQIICLAGGFKCLQQLSIGDLQNLKEIIIQNGTMPILNKLEISHTSKMEIVPDLQYLASLREVTFWELSDQIYTRLKGADQHKVEHIPSIIEVPKGSLDF